MVKKATSVHVCRRNSGEVTEQLLMQISLPFQVNVVPREQISSGSDDVNVMTSLNLLTCSHMVANRFNFLV